MSGVVAGIDHDLNFTKVRTLEDENEPILPTLDEEEVKLTVTDCTCDSRRKDLIEK